MPAQTIAVVQDNGGVGKTTVTLCLARVYSQAGRRVLVVGADPQDDAATAFLGDAEQSDHGLSSVLREPEDDLWRPITENVAGVDDDGAPTGVIQPTEWEGVHFVSAGRDLGAVEDTMSSSVWRTDTRLAQVLAELPADAYDVILIDTAASWSILKKAAIVAADKVLIVAAADLYSVVATARSIETVKRVRAELGPGAGPEIAGVVMNLREPMTTLVSQQFLGALKGAYGPLVLEPPVQQTTVIGQVAATGAGLDQLHDARGKAAAMHEVFQMLAAQVTPGLVPAPSGVGSCAAVGGVR